MPILRYIPGRYNQKYQLKQKIQYIDDPFKRVWLGKQLDRQSMIGSFGVDFDKAYDTFMVSHALCGFSGSRLFYHLLLDFEPGLVDPFQVQEVGQEQCIYLQRLDAMYVWGIHCTPHPHMHVVINSRSPLSGTKLQIKKEVIIKHKIWANKVLQWHQLPLISVWMPDDCRKEVQNE